MNRELDIQIAKVKGLDVIGEAWSKIFRDGCDEWYVIGKEVENSTIQPVYLDHCICDLWDEKRFKTDIELGLTVSLFGHYDNCLSVVPFWSSDLNTAWQLVDEMAESGRATKLENDGAPDIWFFGYSYKNSISYAQGKTKEETICKAYLEWCDLTKNQK